MYEIPHSKILVLGGELKKTVKAGISLDLISSYERTGVVEVILRFSAPGTGMELYFHFEIEAVFLDCKIHVPAIFKPMKRGRRCEEVVFELAIEQTLRLIKIDLTKHPKFMECELSLKTKGPPMIVREDFPDTNFYDLLFTFRKK
jgi:hypothetical protein